MDQQLQLAVSHEEAAALRECLLGKITEVIKERKELIDSCSIYDRDFLIKANRSKEKTLVSLYEKTEALYNGPTTTITNQ